ncbi:MAG TPA: hypothetical protein VFH27_12805 [Longimicrobiaceae bacterium]|nr:hypothetical protein [Longimicrobiaceae bacterium]
MPTAQAAIDSFLRAIEAAPSLWKSIHLRAVAVRTEGTWRNVATRARLDPRAAGDVPRADPLPARGALAGWEAVLPIDALADLLDPLVDGELRVNGTRVLFWHGDVAADDVEEMADAPAEGGPYTGAYRLVDVSREPFASRSGWSEHALELWGGPVSALLGGVSPRQMGMDRALEALRRSRGDLTGWLRLVQDVLAPGAAHPTSLEMVAPVEVRLDVDGCSLAAGRAHVSLSVGSELALPHVSVAIHARTDGTEPGADVAAAAGDADAWMRDGRCFILRDPPRISAAEAELVLHVGGARVDARVVRDGTAGERSARVAAYAVFDPGLEGLRAALFPLFPSQAAEFDVAVMRLLALAGLRVDPAAGVRRAASSAGQAAIAWSREPEAALLVECSAGMVGGESRFLRLRERAARVGQAVGRPVLPVMCTALDRARLTAAEREQAAGHGIALLGREELARLLRMCLDGEAEAEIVSYVASYAMQRLPGSGDGAMGEEEGADEQVPLPL